MTARATPKPDPNGPPRTTTDPSATAPALTDSVVRLRIWGSHQFFPLALGDTEVTIGSAATCNIHIDNKHVSKLHASLSREGARWILRDLASKNGTRLDGWPQNDIPIEPGSKIVLGRVTLIAESMRSIELRTFLGRVIGWSDDRLEDVDLALQAIRATARRTAPLALFGHDDLVSIAYDIHRFAFGERRPFVLCDPRRTTNERTRPGVRSVRTADAAIEAASGGSLCMWATRRPPEFGVVEKRLALPTAAAQLVICGRDERAVRSFGAKPVGIPALRDRPSELEQIVIAYGEDARARLETSLRLRAKEREWVRTHCATALGEIQKGTERLLALKHFGNFARAAAWLDISPPALTEWMEVRGVATMDGLQKQLAGD